MKSSPALDLDFDLDNGPVQLVNQGVSAIAPAPKGNAASDMWDRLIEWLLIALLAFAPLALGVVQAWSELVVLSVTAAMAAILFLKLIFVRASRVPWHWCFVPMAGYLLLVWAQSAPLPRPAAAWVASRNVALTTQLLADLPAGPARRDRVALSIYPEATRHDLRLLICCAAVFVVVVSVFRDRRQIKRLLAAITAIGAGVCLLSLAQHALGAREIYWVIPTTPGGRPDGGPFINHSHFAQFMNLSIGAAIALLLVQLAELASERHNTRPVRLLARHHLTALPRTVWLLSAFVAAAFLSVALSMSRGGVLSSILAMISVGFMLGLPREGRRSPAAAVLPLLGMATLAAVLWVSFDTLYVRFASSGLDRLGGRGQILKDVSQLWSDFPLLGTGQGTFQYAFPLVDRSTFPQRTTHAENEYAQVMTETGALGLSLVAAFLLFVVGALFWCVRRHRSTPILAAACGLGFGLTAILIHSGSDFGQHLPANAFLTSACCGLIVSLGRRQAVAEIPAESKTNQITRSRIARFSSLLASGGLLAMLVLSLPGAAAARLGEREWQHAIAIADELEQRGDGGTDEQYVRLLTHAGRAAAAQPQNVEYRYGLNLHRWQSISRPVDGQGQTWLSPLGVEHTRRIVGELHEARAICPTFGSVYSLVGQLELFVLGRPEGAAHIRTGYRLSPTDASACFVAGQLAASEGAWDESLVAMRRAAQLDGSRKTAAANLYLSAGQPMLAVDVVGDDYQSLLRVAEALERGDGARATSSPTVDLAAQAARAARERAESLLRAECDRDDASPQALAVMAATLRERKDLAAAVSLYRRALIKDYGQAEVRFDLAEALAESGDVKAAVREAKVVVRQRPGHARAAQLLERLQGEAGE